MNRAARRAAGERVDAVMVQLTPRERRLVRTTIARKHEEPAAIAQRLGLSEADYVEMLRAALVKVDAAYAAIEGAQAKLDGHIQ